MTLTAIIMQFLAPPLVFIWLSVLGLLFSFRRFGRDCMVLGMLLLFLSSIPGIGVVYFHAVAGNEYKLVCGRIKRCGRYCSSYRRILPG
ncbi:MAG: hypothetical protein ACJ0DI_15585 [bacterium]